jgi:hypothetical protein
MKHALRLTYVILYIFFLLAEIMLFAKTHNAAISGSLFIFMSLIIVTAIIGMAMFNLNLKTNEVDKIYNAGHEIDKTNGTAGLNAEKESETGNEIDIQQLLPSSKLTEIDQYTDEVLQNLAAPFGIVQAVFYVKGATKGVFRCSALYAYFSDQKPEDFSVGETLSGQAVKNKTLVVLNNIPENYMTIVSGLGKSMPKQLVFVPFKHQDEIVGLIEYATFENISKRQQKALEEISKMIAGEIVKLLKK